MKADYETHSAEPDDSYTLLGLMFKKDDNGNNITYSGGKYNFFNQAKAILLRNNDKQRQLEHYIGYNLERQGMPSIHILLPTENKGKFDSIAHSEEDPRVEPDCTAEGALFAKKSTSHSAVFHLMISSDNSHEVLVIYYFLKSMFTIYSEYVGLSGLLNLTFSGQDITMQQELVPAHIFHRNLSLQFDYQSNSNYRSTATPVTQLSFRMCSDWYLDVQGTDFVEP